MTEIPPASACLEEAVSLWDFDGMFYHVEIDGKRVGAFSIEEIDEDDEICLSLIVIKRGFRGNKYGSELLDRFCSLADKHGVAVQVQVVPTGPLSEDDLIAWYARRGFESVDPGPLDEGLKMSRSPQPVLEVGEVDLIPEL